MNGKCNSVIITRLALPNLFIMKSTLLTICLFCSLVMFSHSSVEQVDKRITTASVSHVNSQTNPIDFSISPNPAKSSLNIKLAVSDSDIKLEVFDVLGKRVYKSALTQLESTIDVSNWKSGVYLVRISDDKTVHTKRFIKQ